MENGFEEGGKLTKKFSGLGLGLPSIFTGDPSSFNNNDSSLFQVMKAVEAAETTIKQQVEENNRLRAELQRKTLLLDKYKLDESTSQSSHSVGPWSDRVHGSYEAHQSVPSVGNQQDNFVKSMGNTSSVDPAGTLILHHDMKQISDAAVQSHADTYSGNNEINGAMKGLPCEQSPADNARFSSPPASCSQGRFQMEGDYATRFNQSGKGLMPMAEADKSSSLWKQDLILKIQEHEEEIFQLRKQLADYSIKEAQISSEKHVLEKRIAYMRLAFDQQQQDLVDAASKALSYRQDIIEENIRLTYQLQDIQQERSTFVSYLLPLLADYSLQPPLPDAHSIVSNIKVLFKHLQEKLLLTESKLKESQYQLSPWRSDINHSNTVSHSQSYSIGGTMATSKKIGLELVPQQTYSHGKVAVSSTNAHTATEWDILVHQQGGFGGIATENSELDDVGKYSPLASRSSAIQALHEQLPVTQGDGTMAHYCGETTNRQVKFRDPISNSEMDDQDIEGNQNEQETSANWSSGDPPYTRTLEELSPSYSPYLPPVLEEPSSSFSEAADDDPLPAIEGLQISGDAFPGRELQACGFSINGTTSCNFEWVRHLPNGSVNYIEGAKQPNYLITADDVDTNLAIEVQPLDNRKRKGELVKVFANDNKKITCDPEMQSHIEKTLYSGHASYKVLLSTGYLDIWEQASLTIKRDACIIKCSGSSGTVITEKFSSTTSVTIPYGSPTDFILTGSSGVEHLLKADNSSDIACSRDTIVLTLRLFILRAGEKRKGKKKGLFFNK